MEPSGAAHPKKLPGTLDVKAGGVVHFLPRIFPEIHPFYLEAQFARVRA